MRRGFAVRILPRPSSLAQCRQPLGIGRENRFLSDCPSTGARKPRCQDSREKHCSSGMRVRVCKHVQIPDECVAVTLEVTRQAMAVPATARARSAISACFTCTTPGTPKHARTSMFPDTHSPHPFDVDWRHQPLPPVLAEQREPAPFVPVPANTRGAATAPGGGLKCTGGA